MSAGYGKKADQVEDENLWITIAAMYLPLLNSFALSLMQLYFELSNVVFSDATMLIIT